MSIVSYSGLILKQTSNILIKCLSVCLQQEKPKLIDPLDYETVVSELGDELKEDPLRDLLLFPDNDFSVSVCVRVCVYVAYAALFCIT